MSNLEPKEDGEWQSCVTDTVELDYVKSLKGLKIIHLNVHLDEIDHDLLDGNFDIIVLSET